MITSREEIREAFRLTDLHNLMILDTPEEPEFDALVQIASELLDCPFSTLTLVDSDRQWFKARVGVSACETPRDISICQHAVQQDHPLIINDLLLDDRVRNSPLVTSSPYLRSYLGVPIKSVNKALIGTLCVFDTVPRQWKDEDVRLIARLTRIAEQLLQKYHIGNSVKVPDFSAYRDFKTRSGICGVWWSDVDSGVITVSPSLRSLLGLPPKVQIDKAWFSNHGVRRNSLADSSIQGREGRYIIEYDFFHPDGSLLKIEETICCSSFNEKIQSCGVVRLLERQLDQLTNKSSSLRHLNTGLVNSNNALEWLALQKVGFIRIDQNDLAYVFDSEDEDYANLLPIPWEACIAADDRARVRNEITATRLGLRTNTLFVRNASKGDDMNWLKLEFIQRSLHLTRNIEVVIEFTQMLKS